MPWKNTTPRAVGDMITAQTWNDEIIGNLEHLRSRESTMVVPPTLGEGPEASYEGVGGWMAVVWQNQSTDPLTSAFFPFVVPPNFRQLVSLDVVFSASVTTLVEVDINAVYGSLTEGESLMAHSEAMSDVLVDVTGSELTPLDVSGVVPDLAPNDAVSISVTASGGINTAKLRLKLLVFRYLTD